MHRIRLGLVVFYVAQRSGCFSRSRFAAILGRITAYVRVLRLRLVVSFLQREVVVLCVRATLPNDEGSKVANFVVLFHFSTPPPLSEWFRRMCVCVRILYARSLKIFLQDLVSSSGDGPSIGVCVFGHSRMKEMYL